jgi:hypothetical protein
MAFNEESNPTQCVSFPLAICNIYPPS